MSDAPDGTTSPIKERLEQAIKRFSKLYSQFPFRGWTFPVLVDDEVRDEELINLEGVSVKSREQRLAPVAGCLVQRQRNGNRGQMYDVIDLETLAENDLKWYLGFLEVMVKAAEGIVASLPQPDSPPSPGELT